MRMRRTAACRTAYNGNRKWPTAQENEVSARSHTRNIRRQRIREGELMRKRARKLARRARRRKNTMS